MKKIIYVLLTLLLALAAGEALAARDGAGNYTLPASVNPVIPGQPIKASWANTTLSDIATEITWSLDRRGYGGMTAALACTTGSASAPSLTFNGALSSGLYLQSAAPATVALSTASNDRQIWTAAGSTLTVPMILPAGSVSAPSQTFAANLTTGVYLPATATLGLAAGGTQVFQSSATETSIPLATTFGSTVTASGTIQATGALKSKDTGGTGKVVAVAAPVGLTADYNMIFPTALPSNPAAWVALTPYAVGDIRTNGSAIYVCDTAGTSAASGGPVGTGSDITDGSARWDYVQATPITDPVKLAATTGQLTTGKITNIDQNFGAAVQERDVVTKGFAGDTFGRYTCTATDLQQSGIGAPIYPLDVALAANSNYWVSYEIGIHGTGTSATAQQAVMTYTGTLGGTAHNLIVLGSATPPVAGSIGLAGVAANLLNGDGVSTIQKSVTIQGFVKTSTAGNLRIGLGQSTSGYITAGSCVLVRKVK